MIVNETSRRFATRAAAAMAAMGTLVALASCGGGTYQQDAFVPARILTFGDESSRLEGPQGLKYSINGVSQGTQEVDCNLFPIWTQAVAGSYGLVYSNCNENASFETNAVDLTKVNGTVSDVVNAVAAFQAGDTFNGNDLVLIWVGMHDILDDYAANASPDETVPLQDMKQAGVTLAGVVNQVAKAGGKVLLLTVPDFADSPFGYNEALRGDFDRAKLLSDMTTQFNLGLRSNIINDGSEIGLVEVDTLVRNAARNPGGSGLIALANETYGCLDTAPLPTCNQNTLRNDPSTGEPATQSFMWADSTHLSQAMQAQIGSQAAGRAHANPF